MIIGTSQINMGKRGWVTKLAIRIEPGLDEEQTALGARNVPGSRSREAILFIMVTIGSTTGLVSELTPL
jgi:hypothetical protein